MTENKDTGINKSRRNLLKATCYTAAALALPTAIINVGSKSMKAAIKDRYETDVLVIGGGFAGLFAALRASEAGLSVTLIDKGSVGRSGMSPWAEGIAGFDVDKHDMQSVLDEISLDSEYLNDRDWMELHLRNVSRVLEEFRSWGGMDVTPHNRTPILLEQLKKANVTMIERTMVTSLIQEDEQADEPRIVGAVGFTYDDSINASKAVVVTAKVVISCMGAGGVRGPGFPMWGQTHDGDALAYSAGASISGKEFHDLHPTQGSNPSLSYGPPMFGAKTGFLGDEFHGMGGSGGLMTLYSHFKAMSGEINTEADRKASLPGARPAGGPPPGMMADGDDFKSMGAAGGPPPGGAMGGPGGGDGSLLTANPGGIGGSTLGLGCHKGEGLVSSDHTGAADGLKGFYAAGDCLASMMTGGIYPHPGYSLIGSAVQGDNAGRNAATFAASATTPIINEAAISKMIENVWAAREREEGYGPAWITQVLQNTIMPYFVTYIKDERRMKAALGTIQYLRQHCVPRLIAKDGHELRQAHEIDHMLLNQEMKFRAGLFRTESRGSHYREDYPARNDQEWLCWIDIHKGKNDEMLLSKRPVPKSWHPVGPYLKRYKRRFPGEEEFLIKHSIT